MPKMLNLPKIGVNMTEALIVEWLVKEGDSIKEGDHILDAETDKAVQEINATMSGVLARILTPVGQTVQCQSPIAILVEPGEKLKDGATGLAVPPSVEAVVLGIEAQAAARGATVAPKAASVTPNPGPGSRVRVSPLAKKTAEGLGIDWKQVPPARPGARIVRKDILAWKSSQRSGSTPGPLASAAIASSLPYSGIRRVIGERMSESSLTKPSVALTLHAEVGKLIAWRANLKAQGHSVGYGEMMVMIAAKALREFPIMNATLVGDRILLGQDLNIGMAVDTERGLFVPVLRNADRMGLLEISEALRLKAEAARSGRAASEDLSGGTFTISNLGMFGIEGFTPIINPPECCILGMGAIVREAVVRDDDRIEVASRMQLTLVFDHRIVDGAPAARFLQKIRQLAEQPMDMLNYSVVSLPGE